MKIVTQFQISLKITVFRLRRHYFDLYILDQFEPRLHQWIDVWNWKIIVEFVNIFPK